MANEKFKVKFGLAVGDTSATIDAATGDIVTNGDIQLGGNDIKASDGNTNITLTSNTLTAFAGDIRVGGNDVQTQDGTTALTFTNGTGDVTVAGDIRINGNDIRASDNSTNITLTSNTLTAFAGDIRVGGNDIQTQDGTTAITLTNATGDVTVAGDVRINGNDIKASDNSTNITLTSNTLTAFAGDIRVGGNDVQTGDGTTALTFTNVTGDVTVAGDVQIGGNDIRAGDGNTNITLTSNTLTTFAGDVRINGNDIRASDGATNITLTSNTLTAFAGDIRVGGNDVQTADGTTALTFTNVTGDVTVAGDLFVVGNEIFSSGGNRNLTFSGTNVIVEGDLTVSGNDIKTGDGTTALTFTNVTGDVAVNGDLSINGSDITTPSTGTATVFNTNATTVNIGGAATTVSIGADTGTTTINNSLVADDISILTVDTTNLEVTNIKAKDGTAAITIADSTGIVTVSTELNVDNINVSGNTIISTDTNGSITLDPNGTGNVAFTFANGGNITNNRNYVAGAIRNATTQGLGDIWALDADTPSTANPTQPFRGLSIDNSADTARNAGLILRNYSNTAANRSRIIIERARGTASSPTAVQNNDFLGEFSVSGCNGTGTFVNDTIPAVPGFFGFNAAETWSSNTNLGTAFSLSLAATATTITGGGNLTQCLAVTPQGVALRSDIFSIGRGKTTQFVAGNCSISGTTLTIGTLVSGSIVVGSGINASTTSALYGVYIVRNISGSGSGSTWELNTAPGTLTGLGLLGTRVFAGSNGTVFDSVADLRLITNTVKGSSGTTQIVTSSAGATLELRGDNIQLEDAAGTAIKGGLIDYRRTFGCFHKIANVTAAAANTVYDFDWYTDTTAHVGNQGVTVTSGNPTRVNFDVAGSYEAVVEMQVKNTDNAERNAWIWLAKNGTDIAETRIKIVLRASGGTDAYQFVTKMWCVDGIAANDYIEVRFAVDNTSGISLEYEAAQVSPFAMPAQPSATFTVTPVGA